MGIVGSGDIKLQAEQWEEMVLGSDDGRWEKQQAARILRLMKLEGICSRPAINKQPPSVAKKNSH